MPYIKVVKTRSYFKRFQVKFKRRREGRTDYYARKRLILQDKNKYNSPKYRLIVRKTNTEIICQIAFATLKSDRIMAAAYSHELEKFGVKGGYKNYSAAYATGLLVARRVLTKLGLAETYVGVVKPEGKHFIIEEVDGQRRPFYVLLDVGLSRTTTGAKIFAAMKGAADGGLEIPHSKEMKQFPGYNSASGKFDSRVLRKYIFGGHVSEYMKKLKDADSDVYQRQFNEYVKAGIGPEQIESMWTKAHAAIRKDPVFKPAEKPKKPPVHKRYKQMKKNNKQRKDRIKQILASQQKAEV